MGRHGPFHHLDSFDIQRVELGDIYGGTRGGRQREAVDQYQDAVSIEPLHPYLVASLAVDLAKQQSGNILQGFLDGTGMGIADFLP